MSADVVPAQEVLNIVGTEGDDSVLIRTVEPETGGAPELLVTLNGQSFAHALEPGQTIRVDLLGGNDVLDGLITVDADWDLRLGDGDDRTEIQTLIGDSFANARYRVDAGSGDNQTVLRFGDGQNGQRLPADETRVGVEYRSGEGNDSIAFDWLVHLDRTLAINVVAETGAGDDVIDVEALTDLNSNLNLAVDAGEGADRVLIGLELPAVRPAGDAGADRVRIDLGAGENSVDMKILGTPPPDDTKPAEFKPAEFHLKDGSGSSVVNLVVDGALTEITGDLGDGDNAIDVNLVGQVPGLVLDLQTGDGDDRFDLTADIHDDGLFGQYDYPGEYAARWDGLDGNDMVHIDWLDDVPSIDLDLDVRLGQASPLRPEVGDQVLIAFEHGDVAAPLVVGMLWNGADKPPESDGEAPPRELHFGVDDGDSALPAVQFTMRVSDYRDEVDLAFGGAFGGLDVQALLGDGDDTIHVDAGKALFPIVNAALPNMFIDLGGGDDLATIVLPAVQRGSEATFRSTIDGGDGLDRLDLATGDADDLLRINNFPNQPGLLIGAFAPDAPGPAGWFVHILPYMEQDNIRTGGGADQILVDLGQTPESMPELHLETGDGDDIVRYRSFAIVDRTQLSIMTGAGDDAIALEIDTTSADGVTPRFEIGVNAGLGGDSVSIDARGIFGEFNLDVDLGADPAAASVQTEKVVITVEHITREYHLSTFHQYEALTSGEGASAIYSLRFRSDDERVQSFYEANTIAGRAFDSVDVHVGGSQTQTVGSLASINVSDKTGTVDRNETITIHSNRTEVVGSEIEVSIHGLNNLSAMSIVGVKVDGGREDPSDLLEIFEDNSRTVGGDATGKIGVATGGQEDLVQLALLSDAPVRVSFAEVSGLAHEVSPAEYRTGVDVGEHVMLEIDLTGLELVSIETGGGGDQIIIDVDHPPARLPALMLDTGDGDDTIDASFIDLLGPVALDVDTGEGDDRINVNVSGPNDVVTGAGSSVPHVKAFTGVTSAETQSFFAYDPAFTGGVRVATTDINGDGVGDIITGAGPGAGPHVKVFDGRTGTVIRSFFAYAPAFTGGVFVAAGDVNGDGVGDIITGAGPGAGPHVKVFDGQTGAEIRSFFAYDPDFTGGVRVAAGDVNNDGFDDIITGVGPGAGPHVKVFDGRTGAVIRSFFAYDPAFTGGVFVTAGDIDGDGFDDVVTGADAGGPAHVKAFNGATGETLRSFFAFDASFRGGVRVAVGDVNGDGLDDIIAGAGPGAGPHVRVFDGRTGATLRSFFAYDPAFRGGVFVASGDIDQEEPDPSVFDLILTMGAGDDHASLAFVTGRSRDDSIHLDMGTGTDSVVLDWQGALQDPGVAIRATVGIDLGGADPASPGAGDQVQVTFMNGDPDRPMIMGMVYNPVDATEPDNRSLGMEIASVGGFLDVSNRIKGGWGNDAIRNFFQGKLRVGGNLSAPPVRAVFDMGGGDDRVQIDLSALEVEGPGNQTPITMDVRGGEGNDALLITGTGGADLFAVNESTVVLDRVAALGYSGFESLRIDTLGGDDTVTMTGINPATRTTIDGGAGRDRFIGRFATGFVGNLTLLNFEQVSIKVRDAQIAFLGSDVLGPVALRLVSERDDGEDMLGG